MGNQERTLSKILSGCADNNINFTELKSVLNFLGFKLVSVNGDHFIYKYKNINALINIQNKNGKAKPYQVKQIRNFIKKYNII